MNLMEMRFKDFVWRDNPTALTVTDSRNVRETVLPYAGTRTEDLGRERRRVTGEGYFAGADCWDMWRALWETYSKDGPGSLHLPGQEPFLAVMDSLKLIGSAGKDLVRYSFSFTEIRSHRDWGQGNIRIAKAGESLWDYAWSHGRTLEELVASNPEIRDIGVLKEGEEVRIP